MTPTLDRERLNGLSPLEAGYAALREFPARDEKQQLVISKCRSLLYGYDQRWQNQPYRIDEVERVVEAPLWNPETQCKSRTFSLAAKIDVTAWLGNRRVIIDHKTCSEDIKDPNSDYWRHLVVEAQPTHYMYMEHLARRKADDAVWDIARKPSISPKQLTKSDLERVLISRHYYDRAMSRESIEQVASDARETLEMYEARLAYDCTVERPEWYFQRRSTPRLDSELHEHAVETWAWGQDIIQARRENRWPKNDGACMLYGRPCQYLGICSGYSDPESSDWKRREYVHPELPVLGGGSGRDILTNSRIRSFKTCRKLHYFRYELGLEKWDAEEAESLVFGHIWHLAQEAWWQAMKARQAEVDTEVVYANA